MCKQIRHTYYCEELFLIKHKTKNIAVKVPYSIISQLMWYIQFVSLTTFTIPQYQPSILDGGSNILLANMLSPKRAHLHGRFPPMAQPLASHPYVLVNRSILCNCHLETGLNYLLKSLSSCDSGAPFTMYFTVNSAFQTFHVRVLACLTLLTQMADYSHKSIFLTYF